MSSLAENGHFSPAITNNPDGKEDAVCRLLILLGMHNEDEQLEFKRLLQDYISCRDNFTEWKDNDWRYQAALFLDNTKADTFDRTIGPTFWPSYPLEPSNDTDPQPKKWIYERDRDGVIDCVTQMMIVQSTNQQQGPENLETRQRKRSYQNLPISGGIGVGTASTETSDGACNSGRLSMA